VSQKMLAAALKVPDSTASKWCSGTQEPRPNALYRIAKFLGVTMERLVSGEEKNSADENIGKMFQDFTDQYVELHSGVYRLHIKVERKS